MKAGITLVLLATATSLTAAPLDSNVKNGMFAVLAADSHGTDLKNPFSCDANLSVSVSGQWKYIANGDWLGADGMANGPGADFFKLPGAPTGGLLLQHGDGTYQYIGSGTSQNYTLKPWEPVHFVMNDSEAGFADNTGALQVIWTLAPSSTTDCFAN